MSTQAHRFGDRGLAWLSVDGDEARLAEWDESKHPRDEQGQFTVSTVNYLSESSRTSIGDIDARIEELEAEGRDWPDDREYSALAHISTVAHDDEETPLSQRRNRRFVYGVDANNKIVAAGSLVRKGEVAEIKNLGSVSKGAGAKVMQQLLSEAKSWGVERVELTSVAPGYYERFGFQRVPDSSKFTLDIRQAEWDESQHPRDDRGRFTDNPSGGGSRQLSERAARAVASHKPATRARQRVAAQSEAAVAKAVGGRDLEDHEPVDVVVRSGKRIAGVEVKTLLDNTHDKVTMHPDSLARKREWAEREGAEAHTVVVDRRGSAPQYYHKAAFGSFRLGSMERVSLAELRQRIGGVV